MTATLAWYFAADNGRETYGRRRKIEVGKRLAVRGTPVPCQYGMHASVLPLDALSQAHGTLVCRVEIGGGIANDGDKIVGQWRHTFAMADASEVLHEFACYCADRALNAERAAGREPDSRSWAAVQAKRDWLAGLIDDEQLKAASKAAPWEKNLPASWDAVEWQDVEQAIERAAAWAAVFDARTAAGTAASNAQSAAGMAVRRALERAAGRVSKRDASTKAREWHEARMAAQKQEAAVQNAELERRLCALLAL